MSLSFREKLAQSVKKGGLSNDELHHPSRAYERYFEGYVESAEPIPNKKRAKSVRTYVDSFWFPELSAKKRLWLRILFAALYLMALPPFLFSATRNIVANTVWFITLPQAMAVFALGWTALCLYRYCTAPPEMTVRQHRLAVTHFHRSSCIAWIALAVSVAAYLVYAVVSTSDRTITLLCGMLCLLSCVCILAMFLVERTIPYTECSNPLARN